MLTVNIFTVFETPATFLPIILGSYYFLPGWGPSVCDRGSPTLSGPHPWHAQKILVPPRHAQKKCSGPPLAYAKKNSGPPSCERTPPYINN